MTDVDNVVLRRGQWLRNRRSETGVGAAALCRALGDISPQELYVVELYDLVLPLRWAGALTSTGILAAPEKMALVPAPCGAELKSWRLRNKLGRPDLASRLGILLRVLVVLESRDLPVPPELQVRIAKIGEDLPAVPPPSLPITRRSRADLRRREAALRKLADGGSVSDAMEAAKACRAAVIKWAHAAGQPLPPNPWAGPPKYVPPNKNKEAAAAVSRRLRPRVTALLEAVGAQDLRSQVPRVVCEIRVERDPDKDGDCEDVVFRARGHAVHACVVDTRGGTGSLTAFRADPNLSPQGREKARAWAWLLHASSMEDAQEPEPPETQREFRAVSDPIDPKMAPYAELARAKLAEATQQDVSMGRFVQMAVLNLIDTLLDPERRKQALGT